MFLNEMELFNTMEQLVDPSEYKDLSFEQIYLLFRDTDRRWQETNLRFQEEERKWKESKADAERKWQEVGERIDRLAKMYGGVSENSKDFAEDFFYRGLCNRDELLGITYEEVGRNMQKRTKKLQGEYDIVLYNGDTIVVIEVKYKLHPNDVQDFHDRKLPNFKILFKEYADKKIVGGVAGLSIPEDSIALAEKLGLIVLCNSGDNVQVANSKDFVPDII